MLLGLENVLRSVASIVSEDVLLSFLGRASDFFDTAGLFPTTCQCPFDPALTYPAYRLSGVVDWDVLESPG